MLTPNMPSDGGHAQIWTRPSFSISEPDVCVIFGTVAAGIVDDAGVLSKASSGALVKKLQGVEQSTGYKIEVITVRKLVFEPDVFAFADQVRDPSCARLARTFRIPLPDTTRDESESPVVESQSSEEKPWAHTHTGWVCSHWKRARGREEWICGHFGGEL